jgi:hypothetical protein
MQKRYQCEGGRTGLRVFGGGGANFSLKLNDVVPPGWCKAVWLSSEALKLQSHQSRAERQAHASEQ